MGDNSAIEWTDATWNPVRGCSIVSKGCTNCYAMRQAHRSHGAGGAYEGLTKLTKGGPVWTGEVRTVPELLDQPLRWRRPRRIFVNSMSDLFHEKVPDDFIDRSVRAHGAGLAAYASRSSPSVPSGCSSGSRSTRSFAPEGRVADAPNAVDVSPCASPARGEDGTHRRGHGCTAAGNVWLGVSVEDQERADERIPLLLKTPAAVRWFSAEPLLGPISFVGRWVDHPNPAAHVNWLERITGSSSAARAGPARGRCTPTGRAICATNAPRSRCRSFSSSGARGRRSPIPIEHRPRIIKLVWTKREIAMGACRWHHAYNMRRVGKEAAGRSLEGRTHDEYPA